MVGEGWRRVSSLPFTLIWPTVIATAGTAILVGGSRRTTDSTDMIPTAHRFDPITNEWSVVGILHRYRLAHAAAALPDGRVMVAGGQHPYAAGMSVNPQLSFTASSVEILNPNVGASVCP